MVLEMGTLERIMERFGERVQRGDDLTAQALLLLTLARAEAQDGKLAHWPSRLSGMPVPTARMVTSTLDAVCPPGRTFVLGLFHDGELWTSLALRRSPEGSIDRIVGPDEIRRDMGLLAGDWRRDFRHLSRSVQDLLGELGFGCFAETGVFRALQVDPTPGAWARAVAVRDVILSPVPTAMALPLGIDAGRAALALVRQIAEQTGIWATVGPAGSGIG